MHLQLTVVDPFGTATPASVELTAAPGTPLGAVREAVLHAVGRRTGELFAGDLRLDDASPLGEPPLLDGAVLTVDRAGLREPRGLLELHVLAGPDSGDVHHLAPGEHGIGRAVEARVRVDDPDVSRLHAVLRVATDDAGVTTVHDLGSTNGTTVDGVPVPRDGQALLPGQVLRVGDTRLSLVRPEQVPVSCRPDGAGHLEVNRPPRHLSRPAPVRVTVPPEPPARERSRFPLIAVLLPLVAGVVLVAVTGSPTYLVFVLLSPLMALGTFWSDRVGGRRSVRAQRAAHAEQQARVTAAIDAGHHGRDDRPAPGPPRPGGTPAHRHRSPTAALGTAACRRRRPGAAARSGHRQLRRRGPHQRRARRHRDRRPPGPRRRPGDGRAGRGRRPGSGRRAQPGAAPGPFAGRAARRLAQPAAPRPGPAPRRADP